MPNLILGAPIAAEIETGVKAEAEALAASGRRPSLVAVRAAPDPASDLYLKRQAKAAARLGLDYRIESCPDGSREGDCHALIERLNADPRTTGIILQLPLPKGWDALHAQRLISPSKDVEGVHPLNLGELLGDAPRLPPCTAAAVIACLDHARIPIAGMEAVVVGRSRIVGRPAALLLAARDATVTVCHRATRDLGAHLARADLVVLAAGKAGLLTPGMIRRGAVVIDVGINEVTRDGKQTITGDADPAVSEVAGAFTPTPGGVGPVTVALLWRNAVRAAAAS